MKKLILILTLLVAVTAIAADFPYIKIRQKDGTEYYIKSEGLRLTVASDKLTVSNSTENAVFNFSDLVSMAFSENAAALTEVTAEECSGVIVYTASGIQAGHFNSMTEALNAISTSGVYVVKSQKGTLKILIER